MPKAVDLSVVFGLPPADAVAYFRAKGYRISDDWQEVWQSVHAKAFTVARAASLDILKAIRAELDAALTEGLSAKQFRERLTPKLKALGWWGKEERDGVEVQLGSPHRLNNIYRVNLQTAYMSGRYRGMLASANTHPYWQYIAIRDTQTRPEHRALHGKVFRYDDPIWQVIFPPNGWGCRCRVRTLTARQVKARGLKVESGDGMIERFTAETVRKSTGEVMAVDHARIRVDKDTVMTPDIGWAYSPGASTFGTDISVAQKLGRVPASIRYQAIQALNQSGLRELAASNWLVSSIERVERYQAAKRVGDNVALRANGPRPMHKTVLSFLDDAIHLALLDKGIDAARVLVISERALAHAHSQKHKAKGQALTLSEYRQLYTWINDPGTKVYWDTKHNNLMLVHEEGKQVTKVVVAFNDNKADGLDTVINVFRVQLADIQGAVGDGKLERLR
ncbi:phage head morphogenesis protein [Pseudoalteromonas sp. CO325X]|uniref:phage head morphogenesis protein n=1 Tax=Pseudoalteromonas sp. CO325X TaxID=1777262 RepID=UPI0010236A66|nr:phage minor head protein [Pseudoalteromonas sp. CO325X]RZF83717.1 phage head morphogenesis protein [Pseudoalteromonas sp. CO325X]